MPIAPKKTAITDGTGQVVAVGADAALPEAVRSAVENSAKRWCFSPPSRDGRQVAGVTYARLDACTGKQSRPG